MGLYPFLITEMTLHTGDMVDYNITASDPDDLPIEYGIRKHTGNLSSIKWKPSNEFKVRFTERSIGKLSAVEFYIRSCRSYHAFTRYDDNITFAYQVLPKT